MWNEIEVGVVVLCKDTGVVGCVDVKVVSVFGSLSVGVSDGVCFLM